jgi:hypothetical protein
MSIKLILLIGILSASVWAQDRAPRAFSKPSGGSERDGSVQGNPLYNELPLSYWISCIKTHGENMPEAFEAIRHLGPRASAAVPELIRIFAEPFQPIRIGVDDRAAVLEKINRIELRAEATDALAAIGKAASPATVPMIQWALAVKVIAERIRERADYELFIDLVAVDVMERMRVSEAIGDLGVAAAPSITALLNSSDGEKRKFAVAILSDGALPIASHLLKSSDCEDRKLGTAILIDMWPVVASDHLTQLKKTTVCETNWR